MNVLEMTDQELLEYIDWHIDGCLMPGCKTCEQLIDVMKELAGRLNVHPFKPHLQKLHELGGKHEVV
jgi:hypothetical protein